MHSFYHFWTFTIYNAFFISTYSIRYFTWVVPTVYADDLYNKNKSRIFRIFKNSNISANWKWIRRRKRKRIFATKQLMTKSKLCIMVEGLPRGWMWARDPIKKEFDQQNDCLRALNIWKWIMVAVFHVRCVRMIWNSVIETRAIRSIQFHIELLPMKLCHQTMSKCAPKVVEF